MHPHQRRSIRLQGYDYSQSGAYFVTICVQNRECLFGDIFDGVMQLNDAGQIIVDWYWELEQKFPDIQCGDFICMPNHVHFIAINTGNPTPVGADLCVCPSPTINLCVCPPSPTPRGEHTTPRGEHTGSPLPQVVQWFKTMTTNAYINGVKNQRWQSFNKRLWQRNYYEHIVRNDSDFIRIQQYIQNNPALWQQDTLNTLHAQQQ